VAVQPDGVLLQWSSISAPERVAVYRQELNASGQPIGESQRLALLPATETSWLDSGARWNRTYVYRVRAIAGNGAREVESLDSTPVRVTPRDVFPPGVPMGLQAVLAAGGDAVDLSWEPVTSADLAGYRVYRRSPGGAWTRINADLVVTPVFRDAHPAAGTAEYAVSAVDQNGNESRRSASVDVTIPAAP
jgi:fibronectin type 3 domain-containing protein